MNDKLNHFEAKNLISAIDDPADGSFQPVKSTEYFYG
jgi:hypothetical protein